MKMTILKRICDKKMIRALMCSLFIKLMLFTATSFAQDEQQSAAGQHEFGVFTGKILPKSIDGASEIFSLSGVRYSYPLSKTGFVDFGGLFGNGAGVKWQGLFLGVSAHIPIETLIAHAGIGLDYTRYESETTPMKELGGGHFIGGIMSHIGGNMLLRFDMKMNSKPGSSLFFGIGFVFGFDFAGGGSSGSGA